MLALLHEGCSAGPHTAATGMRHGLRDRRSTPQQGELLCGFRIGVTCLPPLHRFAPLPLIFRQCTMTTHVHDAEMPPSRPDPSLDSGAERIAPPRVEAVGDAARDAAFEHEVLACLPDVTRYARALTRDDAAADDLVQDTFLLAYRGYHTFRTGEDVRRWLVTICRRAFLRDRMRSARVVTTDEGSDAELDTLAAVSGHAAAQRAGQDRLFERFDLGPAIEQAIASLPDAFRRAVVLVDVEGEGYEEAAAIEAVPVGTIRSRLFRGRRLLQDQLLEYARDAGYAAIRTPPATRAAAPTVISPRRAPRHATDAQMPAAGHTT